METLDAPSQKKGKVRWRQRTMRAAMAVGTGLAVLAASGVALADHGGHRNKRHEHQKHDHGPRSAKFTDLSRVPWAGPAIQLMAVQGIMLGVGNGQAAPNAATTRAEMATMLARMLALPATSAPAGPAMFHDAGHIPPWAQAAVRAAVLKGILKGETGGDFEPNHPVTWAQAAVIIDRVFHFPAVSGSQVSSELAQLPNGRRTPEWARPGVAADVSAGLFQGLVGQFYVPNAPINRAELAYLLARAERLQPSAVAPANSVVVGVIQSVGQGSLIVRTASRGNVTVPLATNAIIYQAGAPATTSDLKTGEHVVIGVDGNGQGALIEIVTQAPPPGQQTTTVTGTVSSVSTGQITVQTANGPQTYGFAPNVTLSGASSVLGLTNDQVSLTINSVNQVTAIDVTQASQNSTLSGTVAAVSPSASGGSITITEANNESATFAIAPSATVSGQASSLTEIQTGAQVTLTISSSGTVTAIDVTQAPASSTVSGSVYSVSTSSSGGSIGVTESSGQQVSFGVASSATVTGQASSLSGVATGDQVTLTINSSGQVTAIDVTQAALPPVASTQNGVVVGATSGANSVTVLVYQNGTPQLANDTLVSGGTVTLNGVTQNLSALNVGQPVTVKLDAQGQAVSVSASSIGSGEQRASGALSSNSNGSVLIYTSSGQQVNLPDGTSPIAVANGSIVALSSVATTSQVTAVSGAANGSLLLVVH